MKSFFRLPAIALLAISSVIFPASAQSSFLGNLLEGVISTSNLKVSDLAGEWTVEGSAVSFQSENLLKKAGGVAAAAAVESKLDPYFKQYGLTGGVFKIKDDGTFTLSLKKLTLNGNIVATDDGNFDFKFTAFGRLSIATMKAFVRKSYNKLDITFEATKLIKFLTSVANLTGMKSVSAITKILDGYDGICVGFGMKKTGDTESSNTGGTVAPDSVAGKSSNASDKLFELLKKKTSKAQ